MLWTRPGEFAIGYQAFTVENAGLPDRDAAGVLYFQVQTPTESAVRKMVLVKR